MKPVILFLEQQSWRGGAQRVLESVLDAMDEDFRPLVGLPDDGPLRSSLNERGIETVTYPLGRYRPGKKSLFEMIAFVFRTCLCAVKLGWIILTRRVGFVYINGPRCLPAGVLAARLTGRPTLFHLHNILSRRADIFLATFFARFATKIIACSDAASSSLLCSSTGLRSKTRTIYNSVPKLAEEESPAQRTIHPTMTIGMVGRITFGKGHHVLIEAFSKLQPTFRNSCRLLVVGAPGEQSAEDDSYLALLKAKARALNLNDQIVWAGYQSEMSAFYSQMDVLVVPSVGSEGLPMVILEAMQRGIPVIATDRGGTREVVKQGVNGLVVGAENVEELAAALKSVLTDSTLLGKLSAGARATISQRFSPELFSLAIKSLARELCPPAPAAHAVHERIEISK